MVITMGKHLKISVHFELQTWSVIGKLPFRIKTTLAGFWDGWLYFTSGQRDRGPDNPQPRKVIGELWRTKLHLWINLSTWLLFQQYYSSYNFDIASFLQLKRHQFILFLCIFNSTFCTTHLRILRLSISLHFIVFISNLFAALLISNGVLVGCLTGWLDLRHPSVFRQHCANFHIVLVYRTYSSTN
jgi:hypothetical protein